MTQTADPPIRPDESRRETSNARLIVLLVLLVGAVVALWYDFKIARPRVEQAYLKVQTLNEAMNSRSRAKATSNLDVQTALGKKPIRTVTYGPYQVEVFGFASGLPFRTHKYYAVYTSGLLAGQDGLVLMRHYAFSLPEDELVPQIVDAKNDAAPDTDADLPPKIIELPGAPLGLPPPPVAADVITTSTPLVTPDTSSPTADEKPADEKPADEKPE